jgi:hypothetical protein
MVGTALVAGKVVAGGKSADTEVGMAAETVQEVDGTAAVVAGTVVHT